MAALTNWAGTVAFSAHQLLRPASVPELQDLVANSPRIRALGSGHSFSTIADTTGDLVSTAGLPADIVVDPERATVSVGGGARYGEITLAVHEAGLALHNLGSLPHISIAGAVATATHGSGDRNGSLAAAVSALELVKADGSLVTLRRGDADFDGAVVGLGALGVVTRLTLDLVPAFEIEQTVYDDLPFEALLANSDEVFSSGYSVSVFTKWDSDFCRQVWVKAATGMQAAAVLAPLRADGPRHPVPGMPAKNCTQQGGVAGPWHDRLAHFRLEFTPSSGEEIQSEFWLPRSHVVEALRAVNAVRDQIAPVLQVSEIRTVAADQLWLSGAYERDSVCVHFTWLREPARVVAAVAVLDEVLAPFAARPHWGKVFTTPPSDVAARYPRYDDFRTLIASYDPAGKFRNDFLDTYFPAQ